MKSFTYRKRVKTPVEFKTNFPLLIPPWLGKQAHVIDTAELTPAQAASEIANTVNIS